MGARWGRYADQQAQARRCWIRDPVLRAQVLGRLQQGWSPEVAGRLARGRSPVISHETIYRAPRLHLASLLRNAAGAARLVSPAVMAHRRPLSDCGGGPPRPWLGGR